jgi:hypothetical protein
VSSLRERARNAELSDTVNGNFGGRSFLRNVAELVSGCTAPYRKKNNALRIHGGDNPKSSTLIIHLNYRVLHPVARNINCK